MLKLERTTNEDGEFRRLIAELDEDLNSRYGELQKQYNGFNRVDKIDTVVIARIENEAVGCGCFKPFDNKTVEIKRVFVQKNFRGNGIADAILKELETWAGELEFTTAILETGKGQPEAIRFYTRQGYTVIPNFGQYIGNDNSVCMKKLFHIKF
ncbi:GNAT family N-acetyltransferase [Paludibacter jiangxiensis]|uniref:Ribosomal protein S18 acetylase RimI n=1 Tax=Paludibacter jiangxiensis TaxID=681398 RepID=A0A161L7M6_9BACT|nr:GNAT family N-acetyltransferase [Paludibacter jiangxiensis]GAT62774.1 ribosomal protein S18 acetylase RimI [Paludibacter jiangxiensis]